MLDVIQKFKGSYIFFATLKSNDADSHFIYLSAYGEDASNLLEKYVEDKRADNEELFAEWDETVEKAKSLTGFSASHDVEDGHIYINTFQDSIGMPVEETTPKVRTPRGKKRKSKVSILRSEMDDDVDVSTDDEDMDDSIDLNDIMDDVDIDEDEDE